MTVVVDLSAALVIGGSILSAATAIVAFAWRVGTRIEIVITRLEDLEREIESHSSQIWQLRGEKSNA